MTYVELKEIFRRLKRNSPREDLMAHIIFTEDSFATPYSLLSRTYSVSSDNKAFWSRVGGRSIFAYCLDRTSDQGVRLDWYMEDEGNTNGWKVENCYILEQMQDAAAIPGAVRSKQAGGTICYAFGDTRILVREATDAGQARLKPVAGSQAVGGKWAELSTDRLYGYCTLLERCVDWRQELCAD